MGIVHIWVNVDTLVIRYQNFDKFCSRFNNHRICLCRCNDIIIQLERLKIKYFIIIY